MRSVAPLAFCVFLLSTGAAHAATVDLADVATPRINGSDARGQTGGAVASAGDVNGDGRDDMLVASPFADPAGVADSGTAHVIYGGKGLTTLGLGALPSDRGFRIQGSGGGAAGFDVAGAGDVNGDGLDDVIVGEPYASGSGAGSAYVIYGASSPTDVNLASLDPTRGFRIRGASPYEHAGWAVASAGDLNDDGLDDVAVVANRTAGGAGTFSVIFGSANPTDVNLGSLGGRGVTFTGEEAGCVFCSTSVDAAGDVNDDGIDDLIVNGAQVNSRGRTDSGSAYVIFGSTSPASLSLGAMTSGQGFRIDGAADYDYASTEVSGAGDVNGDGIDDVALTAPGRNINQGAAYVVFGAASPTNVDLASPDGQAFRMDGNAFNFVGAIDAAGDVNSDGYDDLLIGAGNASVNGRSQAGQSWLVYGSEAPANHPLADLPTEEGFRIDGALAQDAAGDSVAGGFDEDGDGRPDLLIGAPANAGMGTSRAGAAFLVRSDFLPRLQYSASIAGQVGQPLVAGPAFYSRTGTPDFALSGLPPGLSLDPGSGQIRGTPTAAGSSTERITLTDAFGRTATTVRFEIAPAAVGTPPPADTSPAPAPTTPAPVTTTPAPVTKRPVRKPGTKPSGRCAIRLRRGKVNLSCDVAYVRGRKNSTQVAITRNGRTFATAKGVNVLKLTVRRQMRPGRYRLIVRVRSGSTVVTRRQTVRLR